MFWSLVRPDRILPPITRSAAATNSLEADESATGMITCEMFKGQTPEVRPSDQRQAWAPFFQPRLQNAPEATPGPTGGWSEKKEGAHRPGATGCSRRVSRAAPSV